MDSYAKFGLVILGVIAVAVVFIIWDHIREDDY